MRATVHFDQTDYMAIGRHVIEEQPGEDRRYEVEMPFAGFGTLYLDVDCTTEYAHDNGDYYTPPYSELVSQEFDIISWEFLDADGEPVVSDFTTSELQNVLN